MSAEPAAPPTQRDVAVLEEAKKTLEAEACEVGVLTEVLRNLDSVTVDKQLLQQTKVQRQVRALNRIQTADWHHPFKVSHTSRSRCCRSSESTRGQVEGRCLFKDR